MTTREKLAGMALQGILSNSNCTVYDAMRREAKRHGDIRTAVTFAREAVECADALIAELKRTDNESLTVEDHTEQPLEMVDGWIKHDPSGPIPDACSAVRFRAGVVKASFTPAFWDKKAWNHTLPSESAHITHYKP